MGLKIRVSKRIVLRQRSPVRLNRSAHLGRKSTIKNEGHVGVKRVLKTKPKPAKEPGGDLVSQEPTALDQQVSSDLPQCKSKKNLEELTPNIQSELEKVVNIFNEQDDLPNKGATVKEVVPNMISSSKKDVRPYVLLPRIADRITTNYLCKKDSDGKNIKQKSKLGKGQMKEDAITEECDRRMPLLVAESAVVRNVNQNEIPTLEVARKQLFEENELELKNDASINGHLSNSSSDKMMGIKQNGTVSIGQQKGHKYLNMLSKRNRLNIYKMNVERNPNIRRLTRSVGVDLIVNYKSTLPDARFRRKKKEFQPQPRKRILLSPDVSAKNSLISVNYDSRPGTSKGNNQSSTSSDMSTLPTILRNSERVRNSDSEMEDDEELTQSNKGKSKNVAKEVVDVIDGIAFVTFESEHDMVRFTRSATEESPSKGEGADPGVTLESLEAIVPRKTKDIRKIKGWQRKRFSVSLNPMSELISQDVSSEMIDSNAGNIVFEHNYIRRPSIGYESCTSSDDKPLPVVDSFATGTHDRFISSAKEEKLTGVLDKANKGISEWKPSSKSAFVSFSNCHSDSQNKSVENVPARPESPCKKDMEKEGERFVEGKQSGKTCADPSDNQNIKIKTSKEKGRGERKKSCLKVTKSIQVSLPNLDRRHQKVSVDEGDCIKYPTYKWHPSFENNWEVDYERAMFAVTALVTNLPAKMHAKTTVRLGRKRGKTANRLCRRMNIINRRRSLRRSVQNAVPVRVTRASSIWTSQTSDPASVSLFETTSLSSKSPSPPPSEPPSADFNKSNSPISSRSPHTVSPNSSVETLAPSKSNPSPISMPETLVPSNITPPLSDKSTTQSLKSPDDKPLTQSLKNPDDVQVEVPASPPSSSSFPSVETCSQISSLSPSKKLTNLTESPLSSTPSNVLARCAEDKSKEIESRLIPERNSVETEDSGNLASSKNTGNESSGDVSINDKSKPNSSDAKSSRQHSIWEICRKNKFPSKEFSPDQENEDLRVFLRPKPRFQENLSTQGAITKDSSMVGDTSHAHVNNASPPKNSEIEVFKSGSPKSPALARKKLIRELSKLNANFVSVDDRSSSMTNEKCTKEFCKLGCICESIRTDKRLIEHCGRVECMFSCVCPPKGCVSRPSTQIIGSDTVSRLQEESSRHMAKVEKAFHNTVVEAAGELVLPGRRQRERRIPKRFLDEEIIPEPIPKKPKSSISSVKNSSDTLSSSKKSEPKKRSQIKTKACKINLQKILLSGSHIRCMNHFAIDCACIHKGPRNVAVKSTTPRNIALSKRLNRIPNFGLSCSPEKEKLRYEHLTDNVCIDSNSPNQHSSQKIAFDSNHNVSEDKEILSDERNSTKIGEESFDPKILSVRADDNKKLCDSRIVNCSTDLEKELTDNNSDDHEKNLGSETLVACPARALDKSDSNIFHNTESMLSTHCARTAGIDLWIAEHYSDSSSVGGYSNKNVNKFSTKNGSLDESESDLVSQEETTPLFKIVEVKSLSPHSFDATASTFEEGISPPKHYFPNYDYFYSWLNSNQTRCKDLESMCSKSLAPLPLNAVKIMKWKDLDKLLKSHSAHMWIRQRLGSTARIYVTQTDVQPDSACVNFLDLEKEEDLTAKVALILKSAKNDLSNVHGCCILICKTGYWAIAGNINLNEENHSKVHSLEKKHLFQKKRPKILIRKSFTLPSTSTVQKSCLLDDEKSEREKGILRSRKPPDSDCTLNNLNSELSSSPEMNMEPSSVAKVMCSPNPSDILDPDQILLDIETSLPDILEGLSLPKDLLKTTDRSRSSPKIAGATSIGDDEFAVTPKKADPSNYLSAQTEEPAVDSKYKKIGSQPTIGICKVGNCAFTCSSNVRVEAVPSDETVQGEGKLSDIPAENVREVSLPSTCSKKTELPEIQNVKNSSIGYVKIKTLVQNPDLMKKAEYAIESAIRTENSNEALVFPIMLGSNKSRKKPHVIDLKNCSPNSAEASKNAESSSEITSAHASDVEIIEDTIHLEKVDTLSEAKSTPVACATEKTDSNKIDNKKESPVEALTQALPDSPSSKKSGAEPPVLIIDLKKLRKGCSNFTMPVKIPVRVTNLKTLTQGLNDSKNIIENVSEKISLPTKYAENNVSPVKDNTIFPKDSEWVNEKILTGRVVQQEEANGASPETVTITNLISNEKPTKPPESINIVGKPLPSIKPKKLASSSDTKELSSITAQANEVIPKKSKTKVIESGERLTYKDSTVETPEAAVTSCESVSEKQVETSTNVEPVNETLPTPNQAPLTENPPEKSKAGMEHPAEDAERTSIVHNQNKMGEESKIEEKSETPIIHNQNKKMVEESKIEEKSEAPIIRNQNKKMVEESEIEEKSETSIIHNQNKKMVEESKIEEKSEAPIIHNQNKKMVEEPKIEEKSETPIIHNQNKKMVEESKIEEKSEDSAAPSSVSNCDLNVSQKSIPTNSDDAVKSLSSSTATSTQKQFDDFSKQSSPLHVEMAVTPSTSSGSNVATPSSTSSDVLIIKEIKRDVSENDVIWYRLYLNHEFDRLTVEGTSFSTSEKRLISAVNIARSSNRTVRLSFDKNANSTDSQQFKKGIYAVPKTEGMYVKIGPYKPKEPTGVITLKKDGQVYEITHNLLKMEEPDVMPEENSNVKNENPGNEKELSNSNPSPKENKLNQISQEKEKSGGDGMMSETAPVKQELGSSKTVAKSAEVAANADRKNHESRNAEKEESTGKNLVVEKGSENGKDDIPEEEKTLEKPISEVVNYEGATVTKKADKLNPISVSSYPPCVGKSEKMGRLVEATNIIDKDLEIKGKEESDPACSTSTNNKSEKQVTKSNSKSENVSSLALSICSEVETAKSDHVVPKKTTVEHCNKEVGNKDDKVERASSSVDGKHVDDSISPVNSKNIGLYIDADDSQYSGAGCVPEEEMEVQFEINEMDVAEEKDKDPNSTCQEVDESSGNEDGGDFTIKIHDVQGNWSGFGDLPTCNAVDDDTDLFQRNCDELMAAVDKSPTSSLRSIKSPKLSKGKKERVSDEGESSNILPIEVLKQLRKKNLIGPYHKRPIPVRKGIKTMLASQWKESKIQTDNNLKNKNIQKDMKAPLPISGCSKNLKDSSVDLIPVNNVYGYIFPDIPKLSPIRVKRGGGSTSSEVSMITMEDPARPGVNVELANVECVNAYIEYVLRERVKYFPDEMSINWTFVKADSSSSVPGLIDIKDLTKEMFITPKGVFLYADFNSVAKLKNIGLNKQEIFRYFEMKRRKEIELGRVELASLLVPHSKLQVITLEKTLRKAIAEIKVLQNTNVMLSKMNWVEAKLKMELEEKFKALLKAKGFKSFGSMPATKITPSTIVPASLNQPSRGRKVIRGCRVRGGRGGFRGLRKPVANGAIRTNAETVIDSISDANCKWPSLRGRPRKDNALYRKTIMNTQSAEVPQPLAVLPLADSQIMPAPTSLSMTTPDRTCGHKVSQSVKPIFASPNTVRSLLASISQPKVQDEKVPEATEEKSCNEELVHKDDTSTQGSALQTDPKQVSAKENKSVNALLWKESFRKVKVNSAENTSSPSSKEKVIEAKKLILKRKIVVASQKSSVHSPVSKGLPCWNGGPPSSSPNTSVS